MAMDFVFQTGGRAGWRLGQTYLNPELHARGMTPARHRHLAEALRRYCTPTDLGRDASGATRDEFTNLYDVGCCIPTSLLMAVAWLGRRSCLRAWVSCTSSLFFAVYIGKITNSHGRKEIFLDYWHHKRTMHSPNPLDMGARTFMRLLKIAPK